MRSLWKDLALRWLGGEASDGLLGDSALFERIVAPPRRPPGGAFRVARLPTASVESDADADASAAKPAGKRLPTEP